MTISTRVHQQFFATSGVASDQYLIRLPPTVVVRYDANDKHANPTNGAVAVQSRRPSNKSRSRRTNLWTVAEHDRFLAGLERFPQGPWKNVAAIVGTRTRRQTMTHAQKYRQLIERRMMKKNVETTPHHNHAVAEHDTGAPERPALDVASDGYATTIGLQDLFMAPPNPHVEMAMQSPHDTASTEIFERLWHWQASNLDQGQFT